MTDVYTYRNAGSTASKIVKIKKVQEKKNNELQRFL